MVAYASPSNLAQVTPGELSKDQAVPSFYYIDENPQLDPNKFIVRMAYLPFPSGEMFWDSVATSLAVGSIITCLGRAGSTGDLGLTICKVRVVSITPAPSNYAYRFKVVTKIGADSLYSNQSFGPGISYRSNISNSNLAYKGIVQFPVIAGLTSTTTLGGEGVDASCWTWGQLIYNNAHPAPVPTLRIDWIEPGNDQVTIHFQAGFGPGAAGTVYLYLECYKPLQPF